MLSNAISMHGNPQDTCTVHWPPILGKPFMVIRSRTPLSFKNGRTFPSIVFCSLIIGHTQTIVYPLMQTIELFRFLINTNSCHICMLVRLVSTILHVCRLVNAAQGRLSTPTRHWSCRDTTGIFVRKEECPLSAPEISINNRSKYTHYVNFMLAFVQIFSSVSPCGLLSCSPWYCGGILLEGAAAIGALEGICELLLLETRLMHNAPSLMVIHIVSNMIEG